MGDRNRHDPGLIVGALFESVIEDKLGQPVLIAVMLALVGVLLYVVDRVCRQDRGLDLIGPRTGLFVGLAQALALQPGVSLSGYHDCRRPTSTERATAARFSFLLALGSSGRRRRQGTRHRPARFRGLGAQFLAGFLAAAVSGFLVIWFLLRYLRTHDFLLFMLYRIAVALR